MAIVSLSWDGDRRPNAGAIEDVNMSAVKSAGIQRGRPFRKGQSGNPLGKPVGARNHATRMLEQLLEGGAEAVVHVILKKAKRGDVTAARIVLDRILPAKRDRPVQFALPKLAKSSDAATAMAAITAAVADGDLTPSEAAALAGLVDTFTRALTATEFDARLTALERANRV